MLHIILVNLRDIYLSRKGQSDMKAVMKIVISENSTLLKDYVHWLKIE